MIHTARKDRENSSFNSKGSFGKSHQLKQQSIPTNHIHNTTSSPVEPGVPSSAHSNRILAGYMAYEFLNRGTLFGQKFDPARAEAVPISAAEPKRKSKQTGSEANVGKRVKVEPNRSYTEVAELLKGEGGAHIPGVVNPTQLSRWIQM